MAGYFGLLGFPDRQRQEWEDLATPLWATLAFMWRGRSLGMVDGRR